MLKAPNWDALAPHWHCFENVGLNRTILGTLKTYLTPPVLYIGGGRGTYPAILRSWVGQENLSVVDSSLAMAHRAYLDFSFKYIIADARDLHLPDKSFGSVVCATGVLEFLDLSDQKKALQEMMRVCFQESSLLVTAFYGDPPDSASSTQFINSGNQSFYQKYDLLDRWFRSEDSLSLTEQRITTSFSMVAREIGDRTAAYQLLCQSLPVCNGFINLKIFQDIARDLGLKYKPLRLLTDKSIAILHFCKTQ